MTVWDMFKGAWRKFGAEGGNLKAAAVSFYVFLTLLPILLLAVAVLGYVLGSESAFRAVTGFFNDLTPTSSPFITDVLQGLVSVRGGITAFGLITLIWTTSQVFVTLQQALNEVWEVAERPGFVRREVKAIIALISGGVLVGLSIAATAAISFLRSNYALSTFLPIGTAWIGIIVSVLLATAFGIALFALIYRFLPEAEVEWRPALFAGIVAGVSWQILIQLYRVYLENFANYNALYGSLAGVIILVLWIYYSSMILIYCAELAYVAQYGVTEKHEEEERLQRSA